MPAGRGGRPGSPAEESLADRRAAVAELGEALRSLVDLATRTEAGTEVIRESARRLRALAPALRARTRAITEPASVDDLLGGVRMLNPVIGAGNAIAPPLRVEMREDGAEGRCMLGPAYEGPPSHGHGGISALLLDQVLGHAVASGGRPGVTRELSLRYLRPVPLDVPLRVWGRVVELAGRHTLVKGGITTVGEPEVPLVEAEGRFVGLRRDQLRPM